MKKLREIKKSQMIILSLLIIILLGWTIYNVIKNDKFFEASLSNIVTIVLGIFVSYFLTQKKSNVRKQKDIILDLLLKLQNQFESEEMIKLSNQDEKAINMRNRDINNRITILENTKYGFFSKEDLEFVRSKFDEYRTFVGDHIDNMKYLSESEKELKRPLDLLITKLIDMELSLYT